MDTKRGYENITAWQKGMILVKEIYTITKKFPKSEVIGLSSQMRRCAISIPSNIAEGYRRGTAMNLIVSSTLLLVQEPNWKHS